MKANTSQQANGTGFKFPLVRPITSDLAQKIELTFDRMGYRSLSDVYCEADGSNIILKGETRTFYLKQVAQATAAKVAGVGVVINQISVLN